MQNRSGSLSGWDQGPALGPIETYLQDGQGDQRAWRPARTSSWEALRGSHHGTFLFPKTTLNNVHPIT